MISSLELARICGVSQGTVDRALHGRGEISAATKERILKAAKKHGYRPNPLVHELLSGKSRTVGALIPSVNSIFFLDLLSEVRSQLRAPNHTDAGAYRLLLSPVSDSGEFLQSLEDFAARRCSAVLAVTPEEGLRIPATITREMPLICLVSPCKGANVHFLTPDEERTGSDAVDLLHARGHRAIVHLTYTRTAFGIESRARGYRRRMQELGLKPRVVAGASDTELLALFAKHRPSAFFCHNDWLAIATIRTLEKNRIRVPQDVSVLGVDASPTFRTLHSDITTMQYPFKGIARQATELIRRGRIESKIEAFELIEGGTVRGV